MRSARKELRRKRGSKGGRSDTELSQFSWGLLTLREARKVAS